MKKILVVLLIGVLVLGIVGCGGGKKEGSSGKSGSAGSSAAGDASYDKLIDDFDKVVNQYLDLMDAYKEGDDSAWDKALDLQEANLSLSDQLYEAYEGNKLSEAQKSRYLNLFDQY